MGAEGAEGRERGEAARQRDVLQGGKQGYKQGGKQGISGLRASVMCFLSLDASGGLCKLVTCRAQGSNWLGPRLALLG